MHAAYPWNATLMGLNVSGGSLLVSHLNALFTPDAQTPCDLGFPLLITGVLSGTHLSWPSSIVWVTEARCHIASLCCRGHIKTPWWSTSDHLSAPWRVPLARHGPMLLMGPSLRGPPLLAVNDVRGLVLNVQNGAEAMDVNVQDTPRSYGDLEGAWSVWN